LLVGVPVDKVTWTGPVVAPVAGALVQGHDGNFYGTTEQGGSNTYVNTCGTVFKITPTGVLTTLYKFTARGGYDPDFLEQLVQGTDGNFYGTTALRLR
jgi:uncharacterized repeat protein (TIGR03803 family)